MRVSEMEANDVGLLRNEDMWDVLRASKGRAPKCVVAIVHAHKHTASSLRATAMAWSRKGLREPRRSGLRWVGEVTP